MKRLEPGVNNETASAMFLHSQSGESDALPVACLHGAIPCGGRASTGEETCNAHPCPDACVEYVNYDTVWSSSSPRFYAQLLLCSAAGLLPPLRATDTTSALPLKEHMEVWSSTWRWYKGSFEESFAWGRRRKEEAKKKEAQEKLNALQSMVRDAREATHNTPEVRGYASLAMSAHPVRGRVDRLACLLPSSCRKPCASSHVLDAMVSACVYDILFCRVLVGRPGGVQSDDDTAAVWKLLTFGRKKVVFPA